jgi:hypothetical protein
VIRQVHTQKNVHEHARSEFPVGSNVSLVQADFVTTIAGTLSFTLDGTYNSSMLARSRMA